MYAFVSVCLCILIHPIILSSYLCLFFINLFNQLTINWPTRVLLYLLSQFFFQYLKLCILILFYLLILLSLFHFFLFIFIFVIAHTFSFLIEITYLLLKSLSINLFKIIDLLLSMKCSCIRSTIICIHLFLFYF